MNILSSISFIVAFASLAFVLTSKMLTYPKVQKSKALALLSALAVTTLLFIFAGLVTTLVTQLVTGVEPKEVLPFNLAIYIGLLVLTSADIAVLIRNWKNKEYNLMVRSIKLPFTKIAKHANIAYSIFIISFFLSIVFDLINHYM